MSQASELSGSGLTSGIAAITAATFAMSLADAIVKYASASFPLWQIFVVRSLLVIAILAVAAVFTPIAARAGTRWIFLRGLLLSIMYIGIYAAVPVLSLSVIAASLYTAPLFITLLSSVSMREPVSLRCWAAIGIGFAGVLAILRPGSDAFTPWALIPVGAAFFYAAAAILTRAKCAGQPTLLLAVALNLSLLAVGSVASVAVLIWKPPGASAYPFLLGSWITMGGREWGLIAVLGGLMAAISVGLAKAYQSASPSIIATFDYAYLPFAAFWSFAIFGEVPDVPTVLGMALIGAAGLIVVRQQRL